MKALRTLTPFLVLGLALCVTTGSIYVTVKAAAQQDDTESLPPTPVEAEPLQVLPDAPASAEVPLVPASSETVLEEEESYDGLNVIHLNAEGGFNGQLSALSGSNGVLTPSAGVSVQIVRAGVVIATAVSNDAGEFTVSGLSEGLVSVIASGQDALLVFSVGLVAPHAAGDAIPVKLETETLHLEMNSAVVSGSDVALARELIFGSVHPSRSQHRAGEHHGSESSALNHRPVQLQPDGLLVGSVIDGFGRLLKITDLTVHFLRDGNHVASTRANADGSFSIAGLAPGVYSVVTNGVDGIFAAGIHVIGAIADVEEEGQHKLTSMAEGADLVIAPVANSDVPVDPNAPVAFAIAFASATGGGGGGGGGLGLLGLAGLAGLAGGDDDDVSSPSR